MAYSQTSRWLLKENRWRAKRYGTQASFIVEGYDRPFSAEQWLYLAQQILRDTVRKLRVENVFSQARRILRNGTSADRQRSVYRRALRSTGDVHVALAQVLDQLLMETSQEPCISDDLQRAVSPEPGRQLNKRPAARARKAITRLAGIFFISSGQSARCPRNSLDSSSYFEMSASTKLYRLR